MADDPRPLLRRLLAAAGPSGFEQPVAAVFRDAARSFASDIRGDALGNSIAVVNPGGKPRVVLTAHLDEIGFLVSHVDDLGMLWLSEVGGWHAPVVLAQRVSVQTKDGPIPGVIGTRAVHLLTAEEKKEAPKISKMWVDIGARDGEDARQRVRVGDPVILDSPPLELLNGRMASRAMDNRVGAVVVLEAARRAAAAGDLAAEIVLIGSVREEIRYAVGVAGAAVKPDLAVIAEVTHVNDMPDSAEMARRGHDRGLGAGPSISRGSSTSPLVTEHLIGVAEEAGIAYTLEAEGSSTFTDTDALHLAGAGIPCALVSVPLRYMHSPSETIQVSDINATADLIAHFCRSLRPDQEWIS
jgi:putative aminopeptidase FrvX